MHTVWCVFSDGIGLSSNGIPGCACRVPTHASNLSTVRLPFPDTTPPPPPPPQNLTIVILWEKGQLFFFFLQPCFLTPGPIRILPTEGWVEVIFCD